MVDLEALAVAKAKVALNNPIERSDQFKQAVKKAMKEARNKEVRKLLNCKHFF